MLDELHFFENTLGVLKKCDFHFFSSLRTSAKIRGELRSPDAPVTREEGVFATVRVNTIQIHLEPSRRLVMCQYSS